MSEPLRAILLESPLGRLLLAASPDGLALLEFPGSAAESDGERIAATRRRLGQDLEIGAGGGTPAARHLDQAARQLDEYFAARRRDFDLALDTHGSEFEESVWAALRRIPYGDTRSYEDIAQELGQPGGARAVGQANGRNPVAIVVPCHRVINKGGAMGGYGGGLERKRYLLALELRPGLPAGGSGQIQLFGTIPR